MSTPDLIGSQIFYYIKRDLGEAVYAFDTSEGLTVPIFSSMELARGFLEFSRVRGHGVAIIAPTQLTTFSDGCKASGAKYLQLDPQTEVLKGARAKNILLGGTRSS